MPGRSANAWGKALTTRVGRQVAAYREANGLTGKQLSELTRELGLEIKAPVISTIETGTRDSVSAAELLVLARALNVAPVLLLLPIGQEAEVEVLPGDQVGMYEAYQWLIGERPLHFGKGDDQAERRYGSFAGAILPLRIHDRALFKAWDGRDEAAVDQLRDLRRVMAGDGQALPPIPPHVAALLGEEVRSDG